MDVTAPAPSEDERKLTLIMYILAIFSTWLAPLVVFIIKRNSKFVGFHSLQLLFFDIIYLVLTIVGMVAWFAVIFGTIATTVTHAGKPPAEPPVAFFMLFPLIWGGWMLLWMLNLVVCIVFGIKANNGEWTALPVLGTWARRIVKV
jgi:uncharacterized protein